MEKEKKTCKVTPKLLVGLVVVAVSIIALTVAVGGNKENLKSEDPTETTSPEATKPTVAWEDNQLGHIDEQDMREELEAVGGTIDAGDFMGLAQLMLDGRISQATVDRVNGEDPDVLHYMLIDALVEFAERGQIEQMVLLRSAGYVTDACLYDYWEVTGAVLPEAATLENVREDVDALMVHELLLAYQRDDYIIRSLNEMYENGVLNEPTRQELINGLGFDFTNEQYLQDNNIAILHTLTADEKAMYDAIMEYIDQGDYYHVALCMLYGEVTAPTFEKLLEEDKDLMEDIIAQALCAFSEENAYENIVTLRNEGFVSNACFNRYWELIGSETLDTDIDNNSNIGIDIYLIHELEEIYRRDNVYGLEALGRIYASGLINDKTHEKLVEQLGFDYTAE